MSETCWCGGAAEYRVPVDTTVTTADTTMSDGTSGRNVCASHVDADGYERIVDVATLEARHDGTDHDDACERGVTADCASNEYDDGHEWCTHHRSDHSDDCDCADRACATLHGPAVATCHHSAGITHDASISCHDAGATFTGTTLDVVADGTVVTS